MKQATATENADQLTRLERSLRVMRAEGRKALAIYLTAGMCDDWIEHVRGAVDGGADIIEIGIPFSDPVLDGVVIQEASERALEAGMTPARALESVSLARIDAQVVAMTYANLAVHVGFGEFARQLRDAGFSGAILPDLPFDEAAEWIEACESHDLSHVMLAAPTTPPARLGAITRASTGFLYAIGRVGVTGGVNALAASALEIGERVRELSDIPALVGIGITTPEQAATVCEHADGVIIGSAVVRKILSGASPDETRSLVAGFRSAMDD